MKIQLKNSGTLSGGAALLPTAAQMEYGELAINYNTGDPALFIKDSNNQIVRIGGKDNLSFTNYQAVIPIQSTGPSGAAAGNLYFDTDNNRLYIYHNSGWVDASTLPFSASIIPDTSNASQQSGTLDDRYANKTGDTFTGAVNFGQAITLNQSNIVLNNGRIEYEGANNNGHRNLLVTEEPTSTTTVTIPNTTGTLITSGDSGTITSSMIANATIVDADISSSAAISFSKLATGNLPSGITVNSTNIVNGSIVDADINSSAAITLTKLASGTLPSNIAVTTTNLSSPGGTQYFLRADGTWAEPPFDGTNLGWVPATMTITSSSGSNVALTTFTQYLAGLVPASGGGTQKFLRADGSFQIPDSVATNLSYTASTRLLESSTGTDVTLPEVVSNGTSGLMTGAQSSKLAGIEVGATADQTATEIKTAYESNSNTNAFTDAEQTKLGGITAGAAVTSVAGRTGAITLSIDDNTDVDVSTTAPTNGQALLWNSSSSKFLPGNVVSSSGVTQIVAGTNVTISPTGGTGAVTINASGGGGGSSAPVVLASKVISSDYSIPAATNSLSIIEVTISNGVTLTVPQDCEYLVLVR